MYIGRLLVESTTYLSTKQTNAAFPNFDVIGCQLVTHDAATS